MISLHPKILIPYCLKATSAVLVLFLAASCATSPSAITPAPGCYRPHYPLELDLDKLSPLVQRPFTQSSGAKRFLTVYEPGPWKDSYYFIMSSMAAAHAITNSKHRGIILDSSGDGIADCIILYGGTLPDKRGRPVPYNFFVVDRDGDGAMEAFVMEDLDLDRDRVMDRGVVAVLMEPDPEGHLTRGAYSKKGKITPIMKEKGAFLLDKPLWKEPFSFPDDEVPKMTLFGELQKIWKEMKR